MSMSDSIFGPLDFEDHSALVGSEEAIDTFLGGEYCDHILFSPLTWAVGAEVYLWDELPEDDLYRACEVLNGIVQDGKSFLQLKSFFGDNGCRFADEVEAWVNYRNEAVEELKNRGLPVPERYINRRSDVREFIIAREHRWLDGAGVAAPIHKLSVPHLMNCARRCTSDHEKAVILPIIEQEIARQTVTTA